MAWSIIYYLLLLILYRYVIYGYITGALGRQLLGFWETVGLTSAFAGYLILCAVPPYLWSRKSQYHPVWRGIESFVIYLLVALIMGAIFSAVSDDDWSVLSGISASGDAWARVGSVAVLFAVFLGASWQGGKAAAAHRKKLRNRENRKHRTSTS